MVFTYNALHKGYAEIMVIAKDELSKPTKKIEWAGANNPLWYIQKEELKEITADKQPIGKTDHPKPFTTHQLMVENVLILLFTDGYADQFGGPKGKKFKYSKLQKHLLEWSDLNEEEIKNKLNSTFEAWRGDLEQVDDVCIIGIRI